MATSEGPAWWEAGLRHAWRPYTQMKTAPAPLPAVATAGVRIRLADGRELIDGIASWWTACHGYNHPHLRDAVADQLARMPHLMFGGLAHEPALRLAQRLAALLPDPLRWVFFSESGSVSVEIAMKMALQYWINQGVRGRHRFASFRGGYHGDTLGAMSVCDPDEGMHALFAGALPTQDLLEMPRDEAGFRDLERALDRAAPRCAALLIEPLVQGAGGMRFHSPELLARIAAAARARDLLLIFDEIFTGFGRTGTLFACQAAGTPPDIITLSKALSGGTLPLAATVASQQVFDAFWSDAAEAALMHGPTYMANPLACAAAHASLDLFEREPRLEQVARIEAQLREELAPCRHLADTVDVRVRGAIGAVQLRAIRHLDRLRQRFVDRGVWVRPFGDVVYLTPAFTIEARELSQLTAAVRGVLAEGAL